MRHGCPCFGVDIKVNNLPIRVKRVTAISDFPSITCDSSPLNFLIDKHARELFFLFLLAAGSH